jgi:hypothetical protein
MTADTAFFKQPFKSMQSEARLVEYTVLDVEPTSPRGAAGKGQQQQEQQGGQAAGGKRVTNAMIEVALSTDFGVNDNTHIALSHLVRYARQAAALLLLLPPPPPPPLLLSYWLGLLLSFWLGLLLSGLTG